MVNSGRGGGFFEQPVVPLHLQLLGQLGATRADDPAANILNDIDDVETHFPGTVSGIREWFRWYKTPDGKPVNAFGHNEEALGKETALEVIQETHEYWKDLVEGRTKVEKIWT